MTPEKKYFVTSEKLVIGLSEVNLNDVALVGGKNASTGELIQSLKEGEIKVPGGFALTTLAFWDYIYANKLKVPLTKLFDKLDKKDFKNIETISDTARKLILTSKIPNETKKMINDAFKKMQDRYGKNVVVAVRSSATAEDLPAESFAGQHDSFLNISGMSSINNSIIHCYASLFNQRAIKYREDKGFDHLKIAISVGIQKMVRSNLGSSGVCFTLDPDSGFRDVIYIAGGWGLGENIVKGTINPDEFLVYKNTLSQGKQAIIKHRLGSKEKMMVYSDRTDHQSNITTVNVDTPVKKRNQFVLDDSEILKLAKCSLTIEDHFNKTMYIEWAKDGVTKEIYIVRARPRNFSFSKKSMGYPNATAGNNCSIVFKYIFHVIFPLKAFCFIVDINDFDPHKE